MAKEFIVDGALCKCKHGTLPGRFKVSDNKLLKMNGPKPTATTQSFGDTFYPTGFVVCNMVPTSPKPCKPAVTSWSNGFVGIKFQTGGSPLTDESKGSCSCGTPMCIEFIQTGQIPIPGPKDLAKSNAQHQGELDPVGSPAGLKEEQIALMASFSAGVSQRIIATTIAGPINAVIGDEIEYKVTQYNIDMDDISASDRSNVLWKYTIDGKEQEVTQPKTDVLKLKVKDAYAGKELVVKASLNGEDSKDVKTQIAPKFECVVVIGTQQHSSNWLRNVPLPLYDQRMDNISPVREAAITMKPLGVSANSVFMFVHQAIRSVRMNTDCEWTVLLCNEGYTINQQAAIKKAFDSILNDKNKKVVTCYKTLSSPGEIVDYVNNGKDRDCNKITKLLFFSHGVVGKILPWMKLLEGAAFDKKLADKLSPNAFHGESCVYSYACRTGLGNPKIDQTAYVNEGKSQEQYSYMVNESLAVKISESAKVNVRAFMRRSDYEDTLFSSDEYDFLDACDALKYNTERERKGYAHIVKGYKLTADEQQRYKRLTMLDKSIIKIDNARFREIGALHPVKAGTTPRGVPDGTHVFHKIG